MRIAPPAVNHRSVAASLPEYDTRQLDKLMFYYLWPPYGIGQAIIFCPVVSFLSLFLSFFLSFFPHLISVVGDWMSTILAHTAWP